MHFYRLENKRLFTFYFAILHDLMVFHVQIQDGCFKSSVVWILSSSFFAHTDNCTSQWNVTLICFDMGRNDRRALWFCDSGFLSLVFLSLSHLSHLSLPLLFETCESDEVEDKKRPCFTVSGWMKGEREKDTSVCIFMAQNQTIKFPLQPLRPIFHFTMNSVWALEKIR